MTGLKIALIAPPWFTVPPVGYGGIEWVVSTLAEGLVKRGHEVTLFASGGSKTRATLVSTYAVPPSAQLGEWIIEGTAVLDAYERAAEFDVIHDHTLVGLIAAPYVATPVVHTVHSEVNPLIYDLYKRVGRHVEMVAISGNQASTLPPECRPTVIYNGLECDRYPLSESPGDYLLFVGRINPDKGILQAIDIARATGRKLVVLGKVNEAPERAYFESEVRPRLEAIDAEFLDQAPHDVKVRTYQGAAATLFPIQWDEPFGMVMTESMSCGTPVIAFPRGSVPEVVKDGHTGFIVPDVEAAAAAVGRLGEISRRACHDHVERTFSAAANVERYAQLFERIVTVRPSIPAANFIRAAAIPR